MSLMKTSSISEVSIVTFLFCYIDLEAERVVKFSFKPFDSSPGPGQYHLKKRTLLLAKEYKENKPLERQH